MSVRMEETARDYLRPDGSADAPRVTHADRTALVDWMYGLVDAVDGDLETVARAMSLVDRFLSLPGRGAPLRDRRQFQLVAVAALSLCLGTGEEAARARGRGVLATVSCYGETYAAEEIRDAEARIVQGLGEGIGAPTSADLARHFLSRALPGVDVEASRWCYLLDDVRFQLEFAVRDYYFVARPPSTLAMAAILNSLDDVLPGKDRQLLLRRVPSLVREHFPAIGDLLAGKQRLKVMTDGGGFQDGITVVSNSSVEDLDELSACDGVQEEAPSPLQQVDPSHLVIEY